MQLTIPERIQILRKRAGLNQAQLGAKAFQMSLDSGRTRIKNIELGKQKPSAEDLRRIAGCLQVPPEALAETQTDPPADDCGSRGVFVPQWVLAFFPELAQYLEMLDKAAEMADTELVSYLAHRVAAIMQKGAADLQADTQKEFKATG